MSLPSRRYSTIWVEPETPNEVARRVIDQRKAVMVQSTADEFFPKLQRRVQTLDESTYSAPLTLELIQGEVRQALRDPHGGRQRLIDLLDDLGSRLNDTLTSDALPWLINIYDVNEHALRKAETATAPLLYAIGTLTRFDPEGQYASVLTDALERIDFGVTRPNADTPSGSALHAIPAALIVSGSALVAVANKQFRYLSAVLTTTMYPTSIRQSVRTLAHVSLDVLHGKLLILSSIPFKLTNHVRDVAKTITEPFLNSRTLHLDLSISQMLVGLAVEASLINQQDAEKRWWIGEYIFDEALATPAASARLRNVAPLGQFYLSSLFNHSARNATQVAIQLLNRLRANSLADVSSEHIIRELEYDGDW